MAVKTEREAQSGNLPVCGAANTVMLYQVIITLVSLMSAHAVVANWCHWHAKQTSFSSKCLLKVGIQSDSCDQSCSYS